MAKNINGQKQEKSPTKGELEKKIKNAVVFVPKTKDTESIFFSDKGLRLTANDDYAVIETGYHRHVFSSFTAAGISRPWLYTKSVIEIAYKEEKGIKDGNGGYSFQKLLSVLGEKEDKTNHNILWVYDKYLFNLFQPIYSIGESEFSAFLIYESYMHNIAINSTILEEHKDDVTNKAFIETLLDKEKEFTSDLQETVVIKAKTDEEIIKENVEAVLEQEVELEMGKEANEGKD